MTSNAASKPNGDINWENGTDNWTKADASWLNERAIVRVNALPTGGGTPSRVANDQVVTNINEGRVFYDTTTNTLSVSTTGEVSGYKEILASNGLSAVDATNSTEIKYGANNGIVFDTSGAVSLPAITGDITTLTMFEGVFNSISGDRGKFQFLKLIPESESTLSGWNTDLATSFGESTNHIAFNSTTGTLSKYYEGTDIGWRNAQWGTPWGVIGRSVTTTLKTITSESWSNTDLSASSCKLVVGRLYRATLSIPIAQTTFSSGGGVDVTTSFRITKGDGTLFANLPNLFVRADESTPYCATATFTSDTTYPSGVVIKAQYKQSGTNAVAIPAGFQAELVIEDIGPS